MSKDIKCPKCGAIFSLDKSDYAELLSQIKENEINTKVANELSKSKEKWDLAQKAKDFEFQAKYEKLKSENDNLKNKYELEKQQEIQKLEIFNKDLKNRILLDKKDYETKIKETKREYEQKLAQERENKLKLNIKLLGETLEQHCLNEFNQCKSYGCFPNATFEKDNTISSETHSKGDFIFKDYDNGYEYISIMFEMKNEQSVSKTKHKNEDFYKELDKDRKEKKCEYAVLVSMLETDNEFFNQGIVDVSYKNYQKMYVIRPNCFIPLITILVNAAKKTIEYKQQLTIAKNQNIDVTKFEDKLRNFQNDVDQNWKKAGNFYQKTIREIDKSIDHLKKIKDNFESCLRQLEIANKKCQDLSIRKLTHNNPTMKNAFEKAKKQ